MNRIKVLGLASALMMGLAMGGCTTYVNIPAQGGDVARHNPNLDTVQQVISVAMAAVLADQPIDGSFQIILPRGTDPLVGEGLARTLDPRASWNRGTLTPNMPALEARQVRVRGWFAQVDVIRTLGDNHPQLITVDLKWNPIDGWLSQRLRLWRIPVEEALIQSSRTDIEHPPISTEP